MGAVFLQHKPYRHRHQEKPDVADGDVVPADLGEDREEVQRAENACGSLNAANGNEEHDRNDDLGHGDNLHPAVVSHPHHSIHAVGHPADPGFRMRELVDAEVQKDEGKSDEQNPAGDYDAIHAAILAASSPAS